jgi:hypothetical protein
MSSIMEEEVASQMTKEAVRNVEKWLHHNLGQLPKRKRSFFNCIHRLCTMKINPIPPKVIVNSLSHLGYLTLVVFQSNTNYSFSSTCKVSYSLTQGKPITTSSVAASTCGSASSSSTGSFFSSSRPIIISSSFICIFCQILIRVVDWLFRLEQSNSLPSNEEALCNALTCFCRYTYSVDKEVVFQVLESKGLVRVRPSNKNGGGEEEDVGQQQIEFFPRENNNNKGNYGLIKRKIEEKEEKEEEEEIKGEGKIFKNREESLFIGEVDQPGSNKWVPNKKLFRHTGLTATKV